MTLLQLSRQTDRPGRRLRIRRPLVEGLEGRQLLSSVVGNHGPYGGVAQVQKFRDAAVEVQGTHHGNIGVARAILEQGGHLGAGAMIQGEHPGMGVADIIAIL